MKVKNIFKRRPKETTGDLVETSLAFQIDSANEGIDMEQGRQAVSDKYGLNYKKSKHTQMKLKPLVEKTEERAMRITDLRAVAEIIEKRCEKEGWVSTFDGSTLTPQIVNLYDLNYYLIQPSTVPEGVILKGLHHRSYKKGQIVFQEAESEVEKHQRPFGEVMEDCEGTDVLISVQKGTFVRDRNTVIGDESCGSPVFVEFKDGVRMSLKELLHPESTPPDWFISHSWGDSVQSFVKRCELHAKNYCTTWTENGRVFNKKQYDQYSYWVCAYANNQHELASEIVGSPMKSAFMKAITKSHGTLIMMDHQGTCLTRIWCDFEIFMTIMDSQTLDIVATNELWEPFLLTENLLPSDEDAEDKANRDMQFPHHLLVKGMTAVLEEGNSSRVIDKVRILKAMVSMQSIIAEEDEEKASINWNDTGPFERLQSTFKCLSNEERTSYELANDTLHARFAIFAWPKAHEYGIVNNFQEPKDEASSDGVLDVFYRVTGYGRSCTDGAIETQEINNGILDLPSITSKAALLDRYEVTLIGTNQESFMNVFRGIPLNCRYVRVEFHDGKNIQNQVFFYLWEKLSQLDHLVHFDMKIGNLSYSHDDKMIVDPQRGLAAILPKLRKLQTLVLDIEGDTFQRRRSCLSESSVVALGNAINSDISLQVLKFDFGGRLAGDRRVYQMTNRDDILKWSKNPTAPTFRTERVHHGFGNTLSSYAVHEAYDGRKSQIGFGRRAKKKLFESIRYFYDVIQ